MIRSYTDILTGLGLAVAVHPLRLMWGGKPHFYPITTLLETILLVLECCFLCDNAYSHATVLAHMRSHVSALMKPLITFDAEKPSNPTRLCIVFLSSPLLRLGLNTGILYTAYLLIAIIPSEMSFPPDGVRVLGAIYAFSWLSVEAVSLLASGMEDPTKSVAATKEMSGCKSTKSSTDGKINNDTKESSAKADDESDGPDVEQQPPIEGEKPKAATRRLNNLRTVITGVRYIERAIFAWQMFKVCATIYGLVAKSLRFEIGYINQHGLHLWKYYIRYLAYWPTTCAFMLRDIGESMLFLSPLFERVGNPPKLRIPWKHEFMSDSYFLPFHVEGVDSVLTVLSGIRAAHGLLLLEFTTTFLGQWLFLGLPVFLLLWLGRSRIESLYTRAVSLYNLYFWAAAYCFDIFQSY